MRSERTAKGMPFSTSVGLRVSSGHLVYTSADVVGIAALTFSHNVAASCSVATHASTVCVVSSSTVGTAGGSSAMPSKESFSSAGGCSGDFIGVHSVAPFVPSLRLIFRAYDAGSTMPSVSLILAESAIAPTCFSMPSGSVVATRMPYRPGSLSSPAGFDVMELFVTPPAPPGLFPTGSDEPAFAPFLDFLRRRDFDADDIVVVVVVVVPPGVISTCCCCFVVGSTGGDDGGGCEPVGGVGGGELSRHEATARCSFITDGVGSGMNVGDGTERCGGCWGVDIFLRFCGRGLRLVALILAVVFLGVIPFRRRGMRGEKSC
eukprot:PhM_4_TR15174/c1_g3_i1/m.67026